MERVSVEVPEGEGGRTLSGPRDLLHDTLYDALIDAGERLAATSSLARRGEVELDRVQEGAAEALALDALLRELEA